MYIFHRLPTIWMECLSSWTIGTSPNAELTKIILRKAIATHSPMRNPLFIQIEAIITVGTNGLKMWIMSDSRDLCQGKAALRTIPPVEISSAISK